MNLTRIEGPATHLFCAGCGRDGVAGTEPYLSAATGEERKPEEWYQEEDAAYCSDCAAKMAQQDEARSVNQFFSDTAGKEVLPENLPDF
jgi:hypothetical protein